MINLKNITLAYNKQEPLFDRLSSKIEKGGIYGLLGKNGAGKTTLLKILAGLKFIQEGECQVLGENPKDRTPKFLESIFFLPEDLYLPPLTIKQYADSIGPFYPNFDIMLFRTLLEQFELKLSKQLLTLSHGQKKKVMIALGIASHAKLFILDEPSNGLDIQAKTQLRTMLIDQFREDRVFIISTHQVHDVENILDHIILIDKGKIQLNESMSRISEKLVCIPHATALEPSQCIYSHRTIGGYTAIHQNTENVETAVDLELLFNAVVTHPGKIKQIFQA